MRIWKDGDATSSICPACERRTEVVYRRRIVELEDPDVHVPDVLVAVCRECDGIAAIPQQSTPRLRAGIERPKETVNVRLPGHLLDVLALLVDRWAPGARAGTAATLRMLLHTFGSDPAFARSVMAHLEDDPLTEGPADHDLSVRLPRHVVIAVDEMAELVGISTRTDVVRGMLAAAKDDVLDERDPDLAESMRRALAAVA